MACSCNARSLDCRGYHQHPCYVCEALPHQMWATLIFISPLPARLAASLVCLSGLGSSTGQYLRVDGGRLDPSDKHLHRSSGYVPVSVHVWLIPQTARLITVLIAVQLEPPSARIGSALAWVLSAAGCTRILVRKGPFGTWEWVFTSLMKSSARRDNKEWRRLHPHTDWHVCAP